MKKKTKLHVTFFKTFSKPLQIDATWDHHDEKHETIMSPDHESQFINAKVSVIAPKAKQNSEIKIHKSWFPAQTVMSYWKTFRVSQTIEIN